MPSRTTGKDPSIDIDRKADEHDLSGLLTDAHDLAQRLYREASTAQYRAHGAVELARAARMRVERHRRAADRHETAARRHDDACDRWSERGEQERVEFARRSAAIERVAAEFERARADHEETHPLLPT